MSKFEKLDDFLNTKQRFQFCLSSLEWVPLILNDSSIQTVFEYLNLEMQSNLQLKKLNVS